MPSRADLRLLPSPGVSRPGSGPGSRAAHRATSGVSPPLGLRSLTPSAPAGAAALRLPSRGPAKAHPRRAALVAPQTAADQATPARQAPWRALLGTLAAMTILTRDDIARLSPPERLALIGDLWDSLSDAEWPTSPCSAPRAAEPACELPAGPRPGQELGAVQGRAGHLRALTRCAGRGASKPGSPRGRRRPPCPVGHRARPSGQSRP